MAPSGSKWQSSHKGSGHSWHPGSNGLSLVSFSVLKAEVWLLNPPAEPLLLKPLAVRYRTRGWNAQLEATHRKISAISQSASQMSISTGHSLEGRPWSPLGQKTPFKFTLLTQRLTGRPSQHRQMSVPESYFISQHLTGRSASNRCHPLPWAHSCPIHSGCTNHSQLRHCFYSAESLSAPWWTETLSWIKTNRKETPSLHTK